MKYIISEQQFAVLNNYQYIFEQPESVMDRKLGITDRNMVALGYDPKKMSDIRKYEDLVNEIGGAEWDHTYAAFVSLAVSFIPPPYGPIIAGIIQLVDAGVYLYEGDKHSAGLAATFALMPYVGPIMKNFPILAKLGPTKMAALATKILSGATNFTREERLFILTFEKNTGFFVREIRSLMKKYIPRFLGMFSKNPRLHQKVSEFAGKWAYWVGEALDAYLTDDLYNLVFEQELRIRVEERIKRKNLQLTWEDVKRNFGSDGSRKDNELLKQAFDAGWDISDPTTVAVQYRTETKKKQLQDLAPTIKNLRKVLPPDEAEREINRINKMYKKPGAETPGNKENDPFEAMGLQSPFKTNTKQTTIKQGPTN